MSEIPESVDVAVVGAGPAGTMCAWALARMRPDLHIAILDQGLGPVMRPCGEYLAPPGYALLQQSGILQGFSSPFCQELTSITLSSARGKISRHLPGKGWGIRREVLDSALQASAQAHGVRIFRGAQARVLLPTADGWQVHIRRNGQNHSIHTALLVGADGRRSIIRRQAGLDLPTARHRIALMARVQGLDVGTQVEMHLGPAGQIGCAPVGEGTVTVNLLLAQDTRKLLPHCQRKHLFHAALAATPGLKDRLKFLQIGAVLGTPELPARCVRPIARRLALVGDAAAYVDPFTGEGITLAIADGLALAQVLGSTKVLDPQAALRRYARAWWLRNTLRHVRAGFVQDVLAHKTLSDACVGWMQRFPMIGKALLHP